MRMITRLALVVAMGALAAGCAGKRDGGVSAPAAPASLANEAEAINTLLLSGEKGEARKRIKAALKREPMNPSIQLLRDSVEREPQELLGPQSFDYEVRSGDAITALAQRFLGNRLKAYQLGRYNDLAAPFTLTAGQKLRIPGTPPRAEPVRRPVAPTPRPTTPPVTATPAKPAPKPAAPSANPVAGRQLRTAGLAALNQGKVTQAVALLRRAAAADPGNPVIARDLARAQRIAQTVRARK